MGHLFVLNWERVRLVSMENVVSIRCTLGGLVFVILLWCLLLRYLLTMVVCMCLLFMVLRFELMPIVQFMLSNGVWHV